MILKRFMYTAIIIVCVSISIASYLMISTAQNTPATEAEYMIILGAKLNGNTPSLSLQYRLDTALSYLQDHPGMKVVVSGGRGSDEEVAETYAMAKYLKKSGVDSNYILLEDQSSSTYKNLKFSMEKFHIEHTIVVSNDFHLYRVKAIAKRLRRSPPLHPT
jgi:uncharacterized SAM-binding protein YcdF (DUF218 family)